MKRLLIEFSNGLVPTNVMVTLEDNQDPKDYFENSMMKDEDFVENMCYGKCEYLGFEVLTK